MVTELTEAFEDVASEFGETVELFDSAGSSLVVITDALVTIEEPSVARDTGPAEYVGELRVAGTHHALAITAKTASARSQTDWHVLTVADVFGGSCTIHVARVDDNHSNLFDLNEDQAEWA